jgi:hypothetical protein
MRAKMGSLFKIKLQNIGDGSAFIYEVRLLLYPGGWLASTCMSVTFYLLHFPFYAINDKTRDTLHLGLESPSPISDDLKAAAKQVRLDDAVNNNMGSRDHLLHLPSNRGDPDPVLLSTPLKIAEKVPPGDVEWIKLDVMPDAKKPTDCGWVEFYTSHVVVYYDKAAPIVTPIFIFTR